MTICQCNIINHVNQTSHSMQKYTFVINNWNRNCILWNRTILKKDYKVWRGTYNVALLHIKEVNTFLSPNRQGETLFSGKREILSSGNDFILWESDHLSSGNRTTYPLGFETSSGNGTWETGHVIPWELGHLSSGNREFGR